MRNGLASALLEQGIDLPWIQKHMETTTDQAGPRTLMPFLSQPACIKKNNQIRQLIADCKMVIPKKPRHDTAAPQGMRLKQKRRGICLPLPSDYTLDCAMFKRADGSDAVQLEAFSVNTSGIFLTDPNCFSGLRVNQTASADEVAILIVGQLPCETRLKHEAVFIPCVGKRNHPVLMEAMMVQFQSRPVTLQPFDKKEFQAESHVVAFTCRQTDWIPDEW